MTRPIPEGLHTVTPSLTVEGAAEAIAFYQAAFGAEERSRAPDPTGKKIWHAEIRIGDSALFINDVFPEMGSTANATRLWLYLGDVDAAFQRATEAGATVVMPPTDMFWGDRMGAVDDRWGNRWTLAQRIKHLSHAEIEEAGQEFAANWQEGKK
jgi:PhnB protein